MNMFLWREVPTAIHGPPIRGVNLGGWLVLEKWMTPSLFKSTDAIDEYTYCEAASAAAIQKLTQHRETFITKADFVWIKAQGIDAVRLPVGYWAFGDASPYIGTLEYIDKTFDWAEQTGLKVLLDLHGAPGSQNGQDHSGRAGKNQWHKREDNVQKTLDVLEKLVKRYKNRRCLIGIELLNEPGWMAGRGKLRRYYQAAYTMIRRECGDGVWVVYSDFFPPYFWKYYTKWHKYINVVVDTHLYQTFSKNDRRLSLAEHMWKILHIIPRKLRRMQKNNPAIVGEWSLVLPEGALQGLSPLQLVAAHTMYGGAQLAAFENTLAWFYWSYKTEDGGVWSFRDSIKKGLLPKFSQKTGK